MKQNFTKSLFLALALALPGIYYEASAQNVGIGTNLPASKLEVAGDVAFGNVITVSAGATITVGGAANRTSSVVISDNASAAANGAVSLGFTPTEGQMLLILNRDAQDVSFNGTTISQNKTGGFIYLNTAWRAFVSPSGGSSGWGLTGNSSTTPVTNYVGTSDATDLTIAANGSEAIRVKNGGNVGIGNNAPDDKLDVTGNGQISGYLKVGNPATPLSIGYPAAHFTPLYGTEFTSGYNGWTYEYVCGTNSKQWFQEISYIPSGATIGYSYNGRLVWKAGIAGRSMQRIYSPWFWTPTGVSNTKYEFDIFNNMSAESGFDGVYMEISNDGSTWTKITAFATANYSGSTVGSDAACAANANTTSWSYSAASAGLPGFTRTTDGGKWTRVRYVAIQDANFTPGTNAPFAISGFNVYGDNLPTWGGAFASGNVYAEKNVYAGSNILRGDVAEYFTVKGETTPGDLIAIDPNQPDAYLVANQPFSGQLFGVHSTAPTLTLNAPSGTPVALAGRVPVKVSGMNGKIKIGDYLTSSSVVGCAMKADRACFVIGRALESFDANGEGRILCILQSGWYNPVAAGAPTSGGSFSLRSGRASVLVNDPTVQEKSRVFVSFRAPINCGYWISDVRQGGFTVSLGQAVKENTPFDYFVDNAAVNTQRNAPNESVDETPVLTENQTRETTLEARRISSEKEKANCKPDPNVRLIEMPDADVVSLPPSPPDPTQSWIWTADKGFLPANFENVGEAAKGGR